jgi:Family of unknown function (DUF6069)
MSTTQTSQTVSDQRIVLGRLWWVGLITIIAAVVVNILISLVAKGLFTIAPTFLPLQMVFIPFTVFGSLGAIILFALLGRFARRPISTFRRTVWIVLPISFIPDLLVGFLKPYPGTTPLAVGTLMLMHVATAMICLGALLRLGRANS